MSKLSHLLICLYILNNSVLLSFTEQQKNKLESIIQGVDPNANVGIYVISPKKVHDTYACNINRLYTPASCTKLFTAAAVLHVLGPDYRCLTSFVTDGSIDGDSLSGNLYLKSSGDPSFSQENLETMIEQLKRLGITSIGGDICVDFSIFEDDQDKYYANGFCMEDKTQSWCAPVSSFIIDNNCTCDDNGNLVPFDDVHQSVCTLIEKICARLNMDYTGCIRIASASCEVRLLVESCSRPMKELIAHMLKHSDNLYANAMFKLLGRHESTMPGTWESGKRAVQKFLQEVVGIDSHMCVLEDGAGLSRYNLVTPHQIVDLLAWIYNQGKLFPIFSEALSFSGVDGTLKHRMGRFPGLIRAKTGTLSGVSALSGYVMVDQGSPLIFSILINNVIPCRALEDAPEQKRMINYKIDLEDKLCEYLISCCKA